MNRATLIYVVMIAIFGVGLIAILRLGRGLRAPPDLAGKWQCEPGNKVMQIEQSGRFVEIDLDGARRTMRIAEQEAEAGDRVRLTLVGHNESLDVSGPLHRDERDFVLSSGNLQLSWRATRVARKYPVAEAKPDPAIPTAAVTHARN
jgi:hypothetical protein